MVMNERTFVLKGTICYSNSLTELSITENGYLVDLFEITSNIISDVKFDLFKTLIGKGVPESLQTEEYMEFIFKVFKMEKERI